MRTDLHKSFLPLFILRIFYKERAENIIIIIIIIIITVTGFKIFLTGSAFRCLREITIFLSVRPHGTTVLPLNGFSLNLVSEYFLKTCHEN